MTQENCVDRYDSALHKWERGNLCRHTLKTDSTEQLLYEAGLNRSMGHHIFESCSTKCVYDIVNTGIAYRWKTGNCWEIVKDKDCTIASKGYRWAFDHITQLVCHVDIASLKPTSVPTIVPTASQTTEQPTEVPTLKPTVLSTILPTSEGTEETNGESTCSTPQCIPQHEWSEDLMDAYCSPEATGATFKHHCHIGRAAEPCRWFEELRENLQKSLAMRLYSDCSSTCVFDYYSNAWTAWVWSPNDLCWDLQAWGTCQWDFSLMRTQPEWDAARTRISSICRSSG